MPTLPPVNRAEYVELLKVWVPVQVGATETSRAGAASDLMAVVAEPFFTVKPTVTEGLAKPEKEPGKSPAAIVFQAGEPDETWVKNLLVTVELTAKA